MIESAGPKKRAICNECNEEREPEANYCKVCGAHLEIRIEYPRLNMYRIERGHAKATTIEGYTVVEDWPEVMDCKTMANLLGISEGSARTLMNRADFPRLVLGPRMHRIRKGDLLKWLEQQVQ
jgi:predicted DNA-binding transcriptional regulator AlpA